MHKKEEELAKIAEEIERCRACRKWGVGKAVPGEGNPDAKIVFIGEAPGAEESVTGRPFMGRSGKFLRAMIREIGLDENKVYITSPVKYRPKRGTPSKKSIDHSLTHFLKQLAVVSPDIIVLLGGIACLAALGEKVSVQKEHGRIVEKNGKTYLITFHPAAAMRFPKMRREFINDFQRLKGLIDGAGI